VLETKNKRMRKRPKSEGLIKGFVLRRGWDAAESGSAGRGGKGIFTKGMRSRLHEKEIRRRLEYPGGGVRDVQTEKTVDKITTPSEESKGENGGRRVGNHHTNERR